MTTGGEITKADDRRDYSCTSHQRLWIRIHPLSDVVIDKLPGLVDEDEEDQNTLKVRMRLFKVEEKVYGRNVKRSWNLWCYGRTFSNERDIMKDTFSKESPATGTRWCQDNPLKEEYTIWVWSLVWGRECEMSI